MTVPTRGRIFTTADGTSLTFVADGSIVDQRPVANGPIYLYYSGYLLFQDGTRYRIDVGNVTWIRDRNGNRISFTYDVAHKVSSITDSLNRQVTVAYDQDEGGQYGSCDRITFNGFSGALRYIRVCKTSLSAAMRSTQPGDVTAPQTFNALFPELNGSGVSTFNPTVVSSVWLPDNRRYQLFYNQYGDLARVVLPTGGAYEYDWRAGVVGTTASGVTTAQIYRRVVERRVYSVGTTPDNRTTYSRPESSYENLGFVVVEECKPTVNDVVGQCGSGSALLSHSRHYFFGSPSQSIYISPTGYPSWKEGREYKTELYDTNGVTVLRRSEKTWQQPLAGAGWPLTQAEASDSAKSNNPQITQTVATLVDTNQVSKQTFAYDQYLNQPDIYEYDFGLGAPGALVRRRHADYVTSASYTDALTGAHIRNLSTQQWISSDAAGSNKVSLTTYGYDQYGLVPRSGITGSCIYFDNPGQPRGQCSATGPNGEQQTNYTTRGNVTTVTSYANAAAGTGAVTSTSTYDIAGNVVTVTDTKSNTSQIGYADSFSDGNNGRNTYGFPTSGTSAVPDPSGQYGSSSALTTASVWDYSTGQITSSTDVNNVITTFDYTDLLDRLKKTVRASASALQSQTSVDYDDVTRTTTISSDQTSYNDNLLKSQVLYDSLGRKTETRHYEGGTNYIAVQTQYDALGRAFKVSNPFRPWQSESAIWTTSGFDALGRVVSTTTPDSAVVTTSYSGNTGTVTDQNGKARKSVTDGLGRLNEVYEDPTGLNYLTSYSYDALDSLISVTQGSQTRTFVYDSLKRLASATNPESGTVSYQYDSNGNLTQKTDARGVVSTYAYDAFNRNKSVAYTNDPAGTPTVNRYYDGWRDGASQNIPNSKGHLWRTETSGTTGSRTTIDSFDALGRPLSESQQFYTGTAWSQPYSVQRTPYNLAGGVTSQTYPSGHSVAYVYDAAGRASSFTGTLGDGTQRSYSTEIIYSPLGGMTKEKFGTDTAVYNKLFYNSRGQLAEIREGTSYTGPTDTGWERGAIINYYSTCWGMCGGSNSTTPMTDNNGNLKKQEIFIPGSNSWLQQYDYDNLNRLQRVHEYTGNTSLDWQQEYVYDRYGNRRIEQDVTKTYGSGINKKDFTANPANNNRLGVPAGRSGTMTYDAGGNLTADTYSGAAVTRAYDAENRMTSETQANNYVAGVYTYNANGQRVRRKVNGVETWQIYGFDGELLAEYAAGAAATSPQKEYGYRNGQLLVTATVATEWGSAPIIHDNPLVIGETTVQARHITELRDAINALRTHLGMSAYAWQYSATTSDWISANPILEMRTALDQALGLPSPAYSAGLAQGQPIKAIHIQELRDRVLAAWSSGSALQLNWLVTDQLGTPRMVFDKTGALSNVKRHDYLPFGEELFAGQGVRTTTLGYGATDGVRQKFTSKERDIETGLDYFGARYYSSMQGRFTSADPYNIVREAQVTAQSNPDKAAVQLAKYLSFPQQWNRYAYVANNPLKYIDPTGEYLELTGNSQADRDEALERLKIMVGKDAASHLHVVEAVDSNNKAHYYVESDKNLGQVGGGKLGGYISEMIDSNHGVEFKIADSFTTLNETRTTAGDRCGGACTVGAEESVTGNTQIFVNRNASVYAEQSFKKLINSGKYLGGQPSFEEDIVDAHEFGHAYANAIEGKKLHNSSETNERAREFENLQRGTYPYPARRIRE